MPSSLFCPAKISFMSPSIVHTGRQNGVGLNSMCCRVAGVLFPLTRILEVYNDAIPMLICGTIPIVAGGFSFLLPETLNVELQDRLDSRECVSQKRVYDGVNGRW